MKLIKSAYSETFASLPKTRIVVGGVPFVPLGADGALSWIVDTALASDGQKPSVRLSNSYCVALAANDMAYRALLSDKKHVNFADGTPIALLMGFSILKSQGVWLKTKVRGPSLFHDAVSRVNNKELKHFFLGSTDENLKKIVERAKAENPEICIVGTHSPAFGCSNEEIVREAIDILRASRANVIWVGLGTPKQDYISREISVATKQLTVAVGAAFDFYARTSPEAPVLAQKLGLEWLFRMLTEPKRLWKRYLVGNTQFIKAALLQGVKYQK